MYIVWIVLAVIFISFGFVVVCGAPYVPSRKKYVHRALTELYAISKKDALVDIGSGDGIVLREASTLGAYAIGFEINPILYVLSKLFSIKDERVQVKFADIWLSHLPTTTTVVYVFSTSGNMDKLKRWLQSETNNINKTIYLISYGFEIKGIVLEKNVGAYHLYKFSPLHTD